MFLWNSLGVSRPRREGRNFFLFFHKTKFGQFKIGKKKISIEKRSSFFSSQWNLIRGGNSMRQETIPNKLWFYFGLRVDTFIIFLCLLYWDVEINDNDVLLITCMSWKYSTSNVMEIIRNIYNENNLRSIE